MMTDTEREAWLEERRQGVGSSDIPVLAGLSPWKTRHELYLEKKGVLPAGPPSPEQEWGLRLEPAVAGAYQEKRGLAVSPPEKRLIWSAEHPGLFASLDRVAVDGRIVELKTSQTGEGWGEAGTDEVPEACLLQVQQQMLVSGIHRCDIAALLRGSDFRVYPIQFSETLAQHVVEVSQDFLRQLASDQAPPLDYFHPSAVDLVRRLYGVQGDLSADLLGVELGSAAEEFVQLGQEIRDLERLRSARKAQLLHAMADAALARLGNGYSLRRRHCVRRGYQVRDTEYVMFQAHAPKEATHVRAKS